MTLTLDVLTPEAITAMLADSRTRGEYKQVIQSFVDSGELAVNLNTYPSFAGKEASAIRQSVVGNIEKHGTKSEWPTLKVLLTGKDDDKAAILVNMDVHAAQAAAQ